jgi:hypothetical protein
MSPRTHAHAPNDSVSVGRLFFLFNDMLMAARIVTQTLDDGTVTPLKRRGAARPLSNSERGPQGMDAPLQTRVGVIGPRGGRPPAGSGPGGGDMMYQRVMCMPLLDASIG